MENKKYYYLKLKEDFFDNEDIKIIESMENGYLYSNILLKMYLKSLKNNGELIFKDFIPYDTKMLATITGHNIDVVEKALKLFKSLGFIDVLDNGAIFMLDVQTMIGKISDEGIRKKEYREKINQLKEIENGTMSQESPAIISISNSNYNSNISNNIINNKEENKSKRFSKPTIEEIDEYCKERNNNINGTIFYDFYESKGWKVGNTPMKDWKACVRTWEKKNNNYNNNNVKTKTTYELPTFN